MMIHVVLLFLACDLCRYTASANTTVACALFALTGFGILFYVGIFNVGESSYDCLFQTPASVLLCRLWNRIESTFISVAFPTIVTLSTLRDIVEVPNAPHRVPITRPQYPTSTLEFVGEGTPRNRPCNFFASH